MMLYADGNWGAWRTAWSWSAPTRRVRKNFDAYLKFMQDQIPVSERFSTLKNGHQPDLAHMAGITLTTVPPGVTQVSPQKVPMQINA
jgi:hypothetical protein